jgi:hypothetical protein
MRKDFKMSTSNMNPEDDYASKADADKLIDAEQIKQNPDRHKKAMKHVKARHKAHQAVMDTAETEKKVGKGLKKAFPSGETNGRPDLNDKAEKNSAGDED